MEEGSKKHGSRGEKRESFHVIHKVPVGDSPYVRAKHLQLVEKDSASAIFWFWRAINAGDRVDSALKDMAVMMKQQDRAEEAIESIKSFRHLCSKQAQESLDNLLLDFYKGNLGWAYIQQNNFDAAEAVYRQAQAIEPDANKACNLGICLTAQGNFAEAHRVLLDVVHGRLSGCEESKMVSRAGELLAEIEARRMSTSFSRDVTEKWPSLRSRRRLPVFEQISTYRNQMAC